MNGDQKLGVYDQKKQSFIQHFSEIVRVLTEDDMGHPEIGDAIVCLKAGVQSLEASTSGV